MLDEGGFVAARCSAVSAARAVLWLWALVLAWAAPAAALDASEVPEPLRPWVPWVLERVGDSVCPRVGAAPVCVWPGRLELELDERGGHFRLSVQLDRRASVALPGGDEQWPQSVAVDGRAAVVMAEEGAPVVALEPGQHALEGGFAWQRLPETLRVPARIALLELGVRGQRVAQPKRDGEQVWLESERAASEEPESLSLEVFRKLDDEVPFRVHTALVLHVSGRSRELRFPTALTAGAVPIELASQLPARIEPNGELLLQVYPGRHEIQIDALYPTPPERLSAPRHAAPGPAQEIWVFVPHGEYRQTQLEGGVSIDPQRTNLPEAWRGGFASYQLEGGSELAFSTLRRGQPQPPPNRWLLERELWLDLDGLGYTVRDHLSGTIERNWRLDLLRGELGHVSVAGVDQLITSAPSSGARGFELRQGALQANAEWRLDAARSELPAVAWSENVEQLGANLHLPPGWQLLGASGADSVSDSWLSRWDLFALFFVLVIAVAVAKLDRWAWGALALLALLLAHGEPDAPRFLWAAMLLSIALLTGLPAGRFRQLVRALALGASLLLLGSSVSFGVSQIRAAMYPQVDSGDGSTRAVPAPFESEAPLMAPAGAPMLQQELGAGQGFGRGGGAVSKSASDSADTYRYLEPAREKAARSPLLEQDPNAQIQTGPGVPAWRWRTWRLGWSGPVEHTHTLELYLLSPRVNALLSALRIALVGLFTFWALGHVWRRGRQPPAAAAREQRSGATTVALGIALGFSLCSTRAARADIPTPELLEQLKERVQPPRACQRSCLQVSALSLAVSEREVRLDAEVHAAERAAYQLPGPVSRWLPASVEVDGRAASALVFGDDGYLHVRLDPGRHRVRARGPIAGRQLSLDPGTPPHWVTLEAPGWEVSGLSESGQIDGSLGLVRPLPLDGARGAAAEEAPATLPSWARVTRTFSLGVSWSVRTELARVSPKGSLIVARVPLLSGERVTSADVSVDAGVATLRLTGDGERVSFDSVLEPRPALELTAAANAGYSERWVVRCGPIYRCETQGIAPVQHQSEGRWEPAFAPWPGEKLTLGVVRPAAATGQTATIDSASLELTPGVRSLRAELTAHVRLSTMARYELVLPAGSEVDRLEIDAVNEPIRQAGSTLELVLAPGAHDLRVGWQAPEGLRALFVTPHVRFGAELINAEVSVRLPSERWLLAAGGPGWGPAILFWGHLVLISLLAPVLGRLPRSPLRTWQWALLGLGLTQVPLPVAGIVFGWFFVMAFQDVQRPEGAFWFNLRQLLLFGLTLAFLGCLSGAVYASLLETPDMEVAGSGSSADLLRWYVDRSAGALPEVWVLSVSLWVWRAVMLCWALWLAHSLVRWLEWSWRGWSSAGVWKARRKPG